LFALAIAGLAIAKPIVYSDYVENKELECKIPGLSDGYVPQGLCYVDGKDAHILSGYNEEYLALYVVRDDGYVEIISVDAEGNRTESHGGGVACEGSYVYVANNTTVLIYNLSDFMNAKDKEKVKPVDEWDLPVKSACVYTDGDYIYFSEFHDGSVYVSDPAHTYTTPAGDENHAYTVAYKLDSEGGFNVAEPEFIISVKDKVQGFMKYGDTYAVSTSWGLSSSHLTFYKGIGDSGKTVTVSGKDVPLYYLDSSNMAKDVLMPAFSEDLDVVNGRVIVGFESACNKYIVGKFFFANKVISYPLEIEE
jgi:hypothetical protein